MQLFNHGKQGKRERAQAVVEFALVGTIFFLVLFSIFDMTRLLQSWLTLQHSAREGARYAITGRSTCTGTSGRDNCILWTAETSTKGLNGGGYLGANLTCSGCGVTFRAWDYNTAASGGWDSPDTGKTGKECDALEVTVTYKHSFITPMLKFLAPSGVKMKGVQRMTNEPFSKCGNNDGTG